MTPSLRAIAWLGIAIASVAFWASSILFLLALAQ